MLDRTTRAETSISNVPCRHQRIVRGAPKQQRGSALAAFGPSSAIYISVIALGEILKGIALKARTDIRAATSLTAWLEQLRGDHIDRILPISVDVALAWGRLAAERPRSMADGLIAATAAVHGKIIVTRNIGDFADAGVPGINPWSDD